MNRLWGKAAGKHHFVPIETSWKKGETLEDLCVGIIYKDRSTMIVFKCLYYSLIYSHLSYCTVSWGCTYLTKLNCLLLLQKSLLRIITQ